MTIDWWQCYREWEVGTKECPVYTGCIFHLLVCSSSAKPSSEENKIKIRIASSCCVWVFLVLSCLGYLVKDSVRHILQGQLKGSLTWTQLEIRDITKSHFWKIHKLGRELSVVGSAQTKPKLLPNRTYLQDRESVLVTENTGQVWNLWQEQCEHLAVTLLVNDFQLQTFWKDLVFFPWVEKWMGGQATTGQQGRLYTHWLICGTFWDMLQKTRQCHTHV